jgi:hypothetical protein
MKKIRRSRDSEFARSLLELRESGCSFRLQFRRLARANLLLMVSFTIAIAIYTWLQLWVGVYIMLGMLLGSVLRDVAWVFAIKKSWPFRLKVTDWDKVQSLAAELPVD